MLQLFNKSMYRQEETESTDSEVADLEDVEAIFEALGAVEHAF